MKPASAPLRVLLVEDSEDDALLVTRRLKGHDAPLEIERVETADELRAALARTPWDIVVSDYNLPRYSGLAALELVREHDADLPFIIVSATIGEEVAVAAMRSGASDYVMKSNLARLLPAVQRELREAAARREHQARLHHLAYYDATTGLANRTLFGERLAQFVAGARNDRRKLAVLALDIDRIAAVSESLGREAGDGLVAQMGARLHASVPDPAHAARIGAERFAVVLPAVRHETDAVHALRDITEKCLAQPFELADTDLRIGAKCGIALYPDDGDSGERVLRNAEAAVSRARESGERYLFYAEQMTARIAEKLAMETRLRRALDRGEFRLHYQPKVDLRDRRIVAVEALIRWESPELGLVFPAQFVPLLEETGMIVDVGVWVLEQSVRDHRHWAETGMAAPRVAVNVSVAQLHRHDFVAMVAGAIGERAGPPGIDLEITESVLMEDVLASIAKLTAVRDLGISISIDDFGTGYSSLAYLAKLPIHSLKIDRSFVAAMLDEPETMSLVTTIVALAHSLGLVVVAEGVESEAQVRALRLLGVEQMQGYLVGGPVPRDQMTLLLKADSGVGAKGSGMEQDGEFRRP